MLAKAVAKYRHESDTLAGIGKQDNDAAGYRRKREALGCTLEE